MAKRAPGAPPRRPPGSGALLSRAGAGSCRLSSHNPVQEGNLGLESEPFLQLNPKALEQPRTPGSLQGQRLGPTPAAAPAPKIPSPRSAAGIDALPASGRSSLAFTRHPESVVLHKQI